MAEFIREGGTLMFFTLVFGVTALCFALFTAIRPTLARLGFVRWMAAATMSSALLGTILGSIAMGRAVGLADESQKVRIFAAGLAEALNNSAFGLTLLMFITLVGALGRLRVA